MSILFGRPATGTPTPTPTPTPAGVAPGLIVGLAPGVPSTTTIPVTGQVPSGTAPITYVGETSADGGTTWVSNGGSFVSVGSVVTGLFIGLVAPRCLIRITATNAYGSHTTTYAYPVSLAVPATPAPSIDATRFDNFARDSSVAPNSTLTIDLVLNGIARGQSIAGTVVAGSGTIGTPVPFADGTTASQAITYRPAAGVVEHTLRFAATGGSKGLFPPDTVMVNVWSASSGTAQNLAISLAPSIARSPPTPRRDLATMQWRSLASPRGFTGAIGFGPVFLNVDSIGGATDGLWGRPYLGYSTGAGTAVGSGVPLTTDWVQIYGPIAAGFTGRIRTLLPAWGDDFLYWDFASDAAGTKPVRIPLRCRVGILAWGASRSQMTKVMGRGYPSSYESPVGSSYLKTTMAIGMDSINRYPDTTGLHTRLDGVHGDPPFPSNYNNANEPCGTGAMELGRLLSRLTGFGVLMVGSGCSGGGLDLYINADGSPLSQLDTLNSATDGDPRYAFMLGGGLDNTPIASQVLADFTVRYSNFPAWCAANKPSVAVIGFNTGQSGWWGSDSGQQGSAPLGLTRLQNWVRDHLEAVDPRVVALDDRHCAAYFGGHYTLSGGGLQGTEIARRLASAEVSAARGWQTTNRGPRFGTAGQRAAGTNLVRLPIFLGGGSALRVVRINQPSTIAWNYGTAPNPTTTDLIDMVAVYDSGGYSNNGTPYSVTNVAINTSSIPSTAAFSGADATLDVTIAGSGGTGIKMDATGATLGALTVHIYADSGASGAGTGAAVGNPTGFITIVTNDDDLLGIGLGSAARAQLDIQVATV